MWHFADLQNWQSNSWGNQRAAGLTEAQIREELRPDEIPLSVRNASNTVAWWRQRQAVIDIKVCPWSHKHTVLVDWGHNGLSSKCGLTCNRTAQCGNA